MKCDRCGEAFEYYDNSLWWMEYDNISGQLSMDDLIGG